MGNRIQCSMIQIGLYVTIPFRYPFLSTLTIRSFNSLQQVDSFKIPISQNFKFFQNIAILSKIQFFQTLSSLTNMEKKNDQIVNVLTSES